MCFQSIVLVCQSMKEYFGQLYKSEPARIQPWLGQGIFTPDFLGVLISCAPYTEMMDLTKGLHDRDFFQQMDYFEVWSKD